jgi:tellurium resistance protein TerD
MAINLKKGQRINLSKEAPGLTRLMCGLGWDVNKSAGGFLGLGGKDFDLDASVLCVGEEGKVKDPANVVYYGNLRHRSGAITHLGDNLTGEGAGDDEQVIVDLPLVPEDITKLVFVVNIYQARQRKQDFGQVGNAFVRLVDQANNTEVARYNLSGSEYTGMTGMIMAEVYRHEGDWKVAAIGNGIQVSGLEELVKTYSS